MRIIVWETACFITPVSIAQQWVSVPREQEA
jgi:hypothetical protein